jgi:alkylhydroperoxidase family enzyme
MVALPHYRTSDRFSELEKLVLDYAAAISGTPVSVSDELFAKLREHLDDAQLVELTNVIAIENMRGRFNLALGIGAAGFSEGIVCVVPEPASNVELAAVSAS